MPSDKETMKKLKAIKEIQANPAWKERAWQEISGRIRTRSGSLPWLRRAALVGSLAIFLVIGSGALAASAQDSLPGDVLYPVKRGVEKAQLFVTRHPEKRAKLKALYDERRVKERQELIDRAKRRGNP